MVFHFHNTFFNSFNISSLFSGGIIILQHPLNSHQRQVSMSQLYQRFCFLQIHLLLYGLLFWKQFLETLLLFQQQYPIIVFHILLDRFLANDKKSISFDIFSCFWFYRITCHPYLLIRNIKLTQFSVSNGLPF